MSWPKPSGVMGCFVSLLFVASLGLNAMLMIQVAHLGHGCAQIRNFDEAMTYTRLKDPSVESLVSALYRMTNDYPSGTKHQKGSMVDTIVEFGRTAATKEVIGKLRQKTGLDLGDDPNAWMEYYHQHGQTFSDDSGD